MHVQLTALVADASAALASVSEIVGDASRAPRFELFHGANSICSQKVRTVLAQHGIAYVSHAMNIFTGETYGPDHVRLRLLGCETAGLGLVGPHRGTTSATESGCDPAVVPTLIDRERDTVLVDSKRICLYLDAQMPEADRLRPPHLAAAIDAELAIVDNIPNYQMLAGPPPEADTRPGHLRGGTGIGFATSKVQRCERYMAEHPGDPALLQAYAAKRDKEAAAATDLFSRDAMQTAYDQARAACEGLDARLVAAGTLWLFGAAPTLADLFWAVELLRIDNIGAGAIWAQGRLPAVARFAAQARSLGSVRAAVVDWPGAEF